MNFSNLILVGLLILILPSPLLAGSKNFIESYTYNAGEADRNG